MKLAEALMERAQLREQMSRLSERLDRNSRVYEGEEPAEDPARMLTELNAIVPRYEELVSAINTANANTVASNGETLARLIARRDALIAKAGILNGLIDSATQNEGYRAQNEPRRIPSVDVRSLRRESDGLSKEAREIDALIQATNWSTDI